MSLFQIFNSKYIEFSDSIRPFSSLIKNHTKAFCDIESSKLVTITYATKDQIKCR